jgi:phosphoribosylglycinamide formyltransferase-1
MDFTHGFNLAVGRLADVVCGNNRHLSLENIFGDQTPSIHNRARSLPSIMKMQDIVFLCSGGGGNLRFIAEAIRCGLLSGRIVGVVTDRECIANRFAREEGVPTCIVDFVQTGQPALMNALLAFNADVIITNVHRIIAPTAVDAFRGKMINLHYSLLPAFGGMIGTKPVSAALASGCKFIGATVHEIDIEVDAGRPLVQAAIPVAADDTTESVMDHVFRVGCLTLLAALQIRSGASACACKSLAVHGRHVFMNPASLVDSGALDEAFWERIRQYPGENRAKQ